MLEQRRGILHLTALMNIQAGVLYSSHSNPAPLSQSRPAAARPSPRLPCQFPASFHPSLSHSCMHTDAQMKHSLLHTLQDYDHEYKHFRSLKHRRVEVHTPLDPSHPAVLVHLPQINFPYTFTFTPLLSPSFVFSHPSTVSVFTDTSSSFLAHV